MVRAVAGVAAFGLLTAAMPGRDLIDRYGGGGTLRSPDGRWTITAPPAPGSDRDDGYAPAPAYLHGPGVRRRHLIDYDRLLDARWARDGLHVLLRLIDLDGDRLEVRTLGAVELGHPGRTGQSIGRQMETVLPSLQETSRQRIAFGRIGSEECVLIEQDGTPRGREVGSFVSRRAAFRLDLAQERAVRIPSCPGARL